MFFKALALTLILGMVDCGIAKSKHPFMRLKIIKSEHCPDVDNEIKLNLGIKRMDEETNAYTGNATLPFDIGDDVQVQVNVAKWMGEKWVEDYAIVKKDRLCSFTHGVLGETFYKLQDRWNMPRGQCPWPKGFYQDKNLVLDLDDLGIPVKKTPSILRATTRLYKEDRIILCEISTVELF